MRTGLLAMTDPPTFPPSDSNELVMRQIVAIADSSDDIIAATDCGFRPTYINDAGRSFFGLDHNTPAGTLDLYAGIDPVLRDDLRLSVRSALVSTGSWQTEYTLTAPHTVAQRTVTAAYSTLTSPAGEPLGFAVICRDVDADHAAPNLVYVANNELIELATLEDELTRAIELDQFELYFQPVVDTAGGPTRGHEALLRWNHSTRGVLTPAEFLHAVESAGLTQSVGDWTIQAAAQAVADFEHAGCPNSIGINLFSTQLVTPQLFDSMRSAATAADIDVRRLAIEVSEETLMDDVRSAAPVFADLRANGITVAVDDFGTGYSNLVRLRELDVACIKIDRSLIVGIDSDPRARQLLAAVMGLAQALDVYPLAEGVETSEQLDVLKSLGCRYVQGFHTGRPQQLTDCIETLRAQR